LPGNKHALIRNVQHGSIGNPRLGGALAAIPTWKELGTPGGGDRSELVVNYIGSGPGEAGCEVHNPGYDFNDDALHLGAAFYGRLVETRLKA